MHAASRAEAWAALGAEHEGDSEAFARAWRLNAATVSFDDVNDLIERHNRWSPAESRLPMDPRRGGYALDGRDYRLVPLDADWVLERFPPKLTAREIVGP
ncbi:MAG TPA: hypothetical protein VMN35_01460 [Gaiellaceae bacterium]|nr:hypothetical protein [Gaiellaceae bacterium]